MFVGVTVVVVDGLIGVSVGVATVCVVDGFIVVFVGVTVVVVDGLICASVGVATVNVVDGLNVGSIYE